MFTLPLGAGFYVWQLLTIGAAYKAKLLCTNTFFAARAPSSVLRDDLNGLERIIQTKIDFTEKTVTAWLPGIPEQQAVFIDSLGCILPMGLDKHDFRRQWINCVAPTSPAMNHSTESSIADIPAASGNNYQQLYAAIDKSFVDSAADGRKQTRAILIVHHGQIIAERYAPGITKNTPLLGWSMTKSVINALVGLLVKQDKLSIHNAAPVPEWSDASDPRSQITLDQLLRMRSGLEFDETSGAIISE